MNAHSLKSQPRKLFRGGKSRKLAALAFQFGLPKVRSNRGFSALLGPKRPTLYDVWDEVKERWKQLSVTLHPDKGGSHDEFVRMHSVYQAIKKRMKRNGILLMLLLAGSTYGAPIHSPKGAELWPVPIPMLKSQSVPSKYMWLRWTYPVPMPAAGVGFDIEYKMSLGDKWTKIGESIKPPFVAVVTSPRGFFRIGTRRLIEVSSAEIPRPRLPIPENLR